MSDSGHQNALRDCVACVATGKGTAAIATIKLFGSDAGAVLEAVFRPASGKDARLEQGAILVGRIADGERIIDHVVVGCEEPDVRAIHCHGNPLIVAMIMELLQDSGARLALFEEVLADRFAATEPNRIAVEANMAQLQAVTVEGAKIIANQVAAGLAAWGQAGLARIEDVDLAELRRQCGQILARSRVADLMIRGCRVAIVGPPNSGKSTLLNAMAGRQLAIVTDTAGTTRDYVTATCRVESLRLELFDTAGLDAELAMVDAVGSAAQGRTQRVIEAADLILLVLDASGPHGRCACSAIEGKPTIAVLNKSDLGCQPGESGAGFDYATSVSISAKNATGMDDLVAAIRRVTGVAGFDPTWAVAFTDRQKEVLVELATVRDRDEAKMLLARLLNGGAE